MLLLFLLLLLGGGGGVNNKFFYLLLFSFSFLSSRLNVWTVCVSLLEQGVVLTSYMYSIKSVLQLCVISHFKLFHFGGKRSHKLSDAGIMLRSLGCKHHESHVHFSGYSKMCYKKLDIHA